MRIKIFAAVTLMSIHTLTYCAQPAMPLTIANQFFTTLLKGDDDGAVDYFMGLNPKLKENLEQSRQMKALLENAVRLYGKPFSVELVSSEDLSPSLQRRVYVTKHRYHPIVWEMYFYKPREEWLPDQIVLSDQYQLIGAKK